MQRQKIDLRNWSLRPPRARCSTQRGATLLVSLILLLALTVVGVASMRESMTQLKVVTAAQDDDIAFQAAEFALRAGEQYIVDKTRKEGVRIEPADVDGTLVVHTQGDLSLNWWQLSSNASWKDSMEASSYKTLSGAQVKPGFMIELLGKDSSGGGSVGLGNDDVNIVMNYRITARGFGPNPDSGYYVVLQTTIGIPY
jgi:type IV pilus assembly protein PilX